MSKNKWQNWKYILHKFLVPGGVVCLNSFFPFKDRPRKHICDFCGSAFTTASTLRKHVKIHTLEKPHICRYCGKGFIQKVHLQTHLLRDKLTLSPYTTKKKKKTAHTTVKSSRSPWSFSKVLYNILNLHASLLTHLVCVKFGKPSWKFQNFVRKFC